MVDLNLWQLTYDDTLLEFGTHESGHPFTRQVIVGAADLDTDDLTHPLTDGVTFGGDLARGRLLTFAGAHLSTMPQPKLGPRWTRPMDDAGVFEAKWRARTVRRVPGKVAMLANVDRGRAVFGRPRPYQPDHALARQGWLTYECGFVTTDDKFYGLEEKVAISGTAPGSAAAFVFPAEFPHSGVAPSTTRVWASNAGTDETWPVVTFRRGGRPRLELLNDAGGVEWSVWVDDTLAYDDVVTVDARPWSRKVTRNGTRQAGLVRGDAIEDMVIPAGIHELRLTAVDPSGAASVEVRWRDAFAGL